MTIEGELVVSISAQSGRVTRAQARVERPRVAGRLFGGRPAAQVPALAGSLFAICGRSQAIAAEIALDAASGQAATSQASAARDARIAAETIQEHAWRLLVDWPKLAGREPEIALLGQGRRTLAPLLDGVQGDAAAQAQGEAIAWAREALFGIPHDSFLGIGGLDGLHAWMEVAGTPVAALAAGLIADRARLGASDVAFLPFGTDRWVERTLSAAMEGDERFEDHPHWGGEARETGPLARTAGHPLVEEAIREWGRGVGARIVARLVETAAALEAFGGRHGAIALAETTAVAWVDTARGLLVHRVSLEAGRVAGYRIVAPTEWNFHRAGAFAQGALTVTSQDPERLEQDVRWIVASLDPCVGVRYEADHA